MAKYFLSVVFALTAIVYTTQQQCGTNQVFEDCGSSCKAYCHRDPSAISCIYQCIGDCYCEFGYILEAVDSDTCIPEAHCVNIPVCGELKEYKVCGSMCPDYCGKPDGIMCPTACVPGCFCKPGYVLMNRNSANCILKSECVTL